MQQSLHSWHSCGGNYTLDSKTHLLVLAVAQLNIPVEDVEQLLVSLILDNRIAGRLDQVPPQLPDTMLACSVLPSRWILQCTGLHFLLKGACSHIACLHHMGGRMIYGRNALRPVLTAN